MLYTPIRHWLLFAWLTVAIMLADQVVKAWVLKSLSPGESVVLLPGVFQLTLVFNTGAAFSLFHQQPVLLLLLVTLMLGGLLTYCLFKAHWSRGESVAFAMIVGGALGNLLDRLRLGKVVDYLDVSAIQYPVFNLADMLICMGVAWVLWQHLAQEKLQEKKSVTLTESSE